MPKIELAKDASFSWLEIGDGLPVLVVDNALQNPAEVQRAAWSCRFHLPGPREYYPGWQASAQMDGEKNLIREIGTLFLNRLWPNGWPRSLTVDDIEPHSTFSAFCMDHAKAAKNGYIDQHVDTYSWIAVVTYLFDHDESANFDRGTAFWRHRRTELDTFFLGDLLQAAHIEGLFGLKFIDKFKRAALRINAANMEEAQKWILENRESSRRFFSLEEDRTWALTKFVPARFNRMIAYPTWQFHSIVDTAPLAPLSISNARLTYNTFIPYPLPASAGPQPKYTGGGYGTIEGMYID